MNHIQLRHTKATSSSTSVHFTKSLTVMFLLVVLLALLRAETVVSSSNQTIQYGYTFSGIQNGINYRPSLHSLLDTFSSQASKTGFYNSSSIGHGPEDQLSGLYFCRGDIDRQQCRDCVNYAKHTFLTCPSNAEEAMLWYDHCMVRYSNKPFLGKLDFRAGFSSWENESISGDRTLFKKTLMNTMRVLTIRAAYSESSRKFATRVVKINDEESLYALVQCSPDLSAADCHMCLINSMEGVRKMRFSKGGKVMRLNCMVRYETFPFFYSKDSKFLPVSSSLQAANWTMVRLRVQVDPFVLPVNPTRSNVSSIHAVDNSTIKFRARLVVRPFSSKTIKLRLCFPSGPVANSTIIEEGVEAGEVYNKAMES